MVYIGRGGPEVWLGGNSVAYSSQWVWTDGTPLISFGGPGQGFGGPDLGFEGPGKIESYGTPLGKTAHSLSWSPCVVLNFILRSETFLIVNGLKCSIPLTLMIFVDFALIT